MYRSYILHSQVNETYIYRRDFNQLYGNKKGERNETRRYKNMDSLKPKLKAALEFFCAGLRARLCRVIRKAGSAGTIFFTSQIMPGTYYSDVNNWLRAC